MASKESTSRVVIVTVALCLVCSVIVSAAAVLLRPAQIANKELDFKRSVVAIAHIEEANKSIEEVYAERVETRLVDLNTGKFSDAFDPLTFNQSAALKDSALSTRLTTAQDVAKIGTRENYSVVYLINNEKGELEKLILPVRGKGLWSTMYGLMVLSSDLNTVSGFGFYQQGETPGLGAEVDNPRWKALWPGKEVYDAKGNVALGVIKGSVDETSPMAKHQVDGLSGATLTGNGVRELIKFWLGEDGFKPFINNLKKGEA